MKHGSPEHVQLVRSQTHTLYSPEQEKDACGVGFIAHLKGKKSHQIIRQGLQILDNLEHRGAAGCDPCTGDGAGILSQIPDAFFRAQLAEHGYKLPQAGKYAIAQVFLPQREDEFELCRGIVDQVIVEEGLKALVWREVPVDESKLGPQARSIAPRIYQLFILGDFPDTVAFDRKLYVIRSVIEQRVRERKLQNEHMFYVCSMSARTIVYKGLLLPYQVEQFYLDLHDERFTSALVIIHSRYSTNTLPTWDLSHPFRYLAHNGEINTLRGNKNWMRGRERQLRSSLFSDADIRKLPPIINEAGSDSACFDNALELLLLSGRSLPEAMMMMVPEAWENDTHMEADRRAFYEYHACSQEPWDGPAALAYSDGTAIGATLDRNGLRPARYIVTTDDYVIMASEVGVLDIPASKIVHKGRLHPGRMFVVDPSQGRIIHDSEIKKSVAAKHPYQKWLDAGRMTLDSLPAVKGEPVATDPASLLQQQRAFGYSYEDLRAIIAPMANDGKEPVFSMGNDAALAVLSNRPRLLFDYFKQLFAQVTNPPIDSDRERLVMTLLSIEGPQYNLLEDTAEKCQRLFLEQPVLDDAEIERLASANTRSMRGARVSTLFDPSKGANALEQAVERLCADVVAAVKAGKTLIVLSDRGVHAQAAAIPALLAVGAVHHHLIRANLRTQCGLFVESGEVREVSHFALLIGYGAGGINPYLALASAADLVRKGYLGGGLTVAQAIKNYKKAVGYALLKIFAKMGISTLQSYKGAQIFEAVGLARSVVDKYFNGTASRIEGSDMQVIGEEVARRHMQAYQGRWLGERLDVGGQLHYRKDGEFHQWNPDTIALLQRAVREGDYARFKEFTRAANDQSRQMATLRGLLDFKPGKSIALDQVESEKDSVRRFATGAMSFGSISREAHETLAIAMNRIGGRSNTGEGGEDPRRYKPDAQGNLRRSSIKQVASGRFGVTTEYLVNADELQIKMAQGAKPGEGGQLPGHKVSQEIASVRHSTPGVQLISPPPHHDIYSIEDLAQLIFDLKNVNPAARVSVKLVSEVGVGTVAAGVSKGHADVVLISGHDGGTGASPLSSIKHAGMPWEIGLAETQQVLVQNDLRSRIIVQTDGQLKTGRDVVIAALLGAEEFGFATMALVAEGCIMMRKCHLNTCPVGVATQDPELRKKFTGTPEDIVNLFMFLAREIREIMAELGFRTFAEMVGHVERLDARTATAHWKAKGIDLSKLLARPVAPATAPLCQTTTQDHGLASVLDHELIKRSGPALEKKRAVKFALPIRNRNRTCGTMLSGEVAKRYGNAGLPEGTIDVTFTGSAGQSFGAFLAHGVSFTLVGDSNDYLGKGLSGGSIAVLPPKDAKFAAEENIIVGNTCLYGATGGTALIRGRAGERFAVRNSGATAVVEGVGDHGCEYMTGGTVVVIGETGRNFAAGMSGGLAYVWDPHGKFNDRCNTELVSLFDVEAEDADALRELIARHHKATGSQQAQRLLKNWKSTVKEFRKVYPNDLRKVHEQRKAAALKEVAHG